MKKLLLLLAVLLALTACRRPRVRHNYDKHMPHAVVPVDTAQKNDFNEVEEEIAGLNDDEPLIELPETPKRGKAPANIDEQIERMMMGEDVRDDE